MSESDEADEAYADVAAAMESAFIAARTKRPQLTQAELFVALLLLKDRILENHLPIDSLPPELTTLARDLYGV